MSSNWEGGGFRTKLLELSSSLSALNVVASYVQVKCIIVWGTKWK